ncbi:hypothetical protein ASPFODRAFT_245949 [Aspergillus luchuensis CBS 106.47]|uniref:Uncharacterized protein n=1 Tax=Aspergillus luchuensis (strain CBS 106.47) TaxID=1137211 RepID=A0A1M3TZ18_ASPLC|nr:hypothetical protein ASPFODRAFT_245949 [Aspergillus luchuensis CBS 106.47]
MNKLPESASPIIHTSGIFSVIQVLLALVAIHSLITMCVNFIPYSKLTYSIDVSLKAHIHHHREPFSGVYSAVRR